MELRRPELAADLVRMRGGRDAPARAVGDNVAFEENVSVARRADFEAATGGATEVLGALATYFRRTVQGMRLDHWPSTFDAARGAALLPAGVAGNQKIVRIVCLDDWQTPERFARLEEAVLPHQRDGSVIEPEIRELNRYPGARPFWAAFLSEVTDDVADADWLRRLTTRLGLGHHAAAAGQTRYFALMEYRAADVMDGTGIAQSFAVPSVLEAGNNPWFHPAPRASDAGFAADLDPALGRDLVREFLHTRLMFRADHMIKVGRIVGPTPLVRIGTVRDGHVDRLRARAGRPDFGAMMTGEVDE